MGDLTPYNGIDVTATTQFDTLPERAETQRGLVAVAMSGGVDSSAVAALLQQQGRTVVGLTMQLWNQRRLPELQGAGPAQHRCCSLDDVYDAKAVAQHLNFPHYVVNSRRALCAPSWTSISPVARPSPAPIATRM